MRDNRSCTLYSGLGASQSVMSSAFFLSITLAFSTQEVSLLGPPESASCEPGKTPQQAVATTLSAWFTNPSGNLPNWPRSRLALITIIQVHGDGGLRLLVRVRVLFGVF